MTGALLLLLSGCALLDGGNSMSARGDAPFSLGRVASALWLEGRWSDPDDGEGYGYLLLTSEELDCDDLKEELDGVPMRDSVLFRADGVLAEFAWYDPDGGAEGFDGDYVSGLYPLGYGELGGDTLRVFQAGAFSDGGTWSDYQGLGSASLEFDGDTVRGKLKTEWIRARFAAEDCGAQAPYEDDDTTWGWDTGW